MLSVKVVALGDMPLRRLATEDRLSARYASCFRDTVGVARVRWEGRDGQIESPLVVTLQSQPVKCEIVVCRLCRCLYQVMNHTDGR